MYKSVLLKLGGFLWTVVRIVVKKCIVIPHVSYSLVLAEGLFFGDCQAGAGDGDGEDIMAGDNTIGVINIKFR